MSEFRLAYVYRLCPTKAQETALTETLETCRQVYNSLLNWRKHDYEVLGKSPSKVEQQAAFPRWKKEHVELGEVYSQTLQNVAVRVDLAFDAFFRRVKAAETPSRASIAGKTPGFPRIKGRGQYDSLTFPQSGFGFCQGRLRLSKIGDLAIRLHRPIDGDMKSLIKTCTVRRICHKWYACLSCEVGAEALPPSKEEVGIDVGLKTFASLSNGEMIENPRFFRKDEKALAKAQRKLAKQIRGSKARRNSEARCRKSHAKKVVSRVHERIRNRRHDFVHQTARRLVNRFGVISVEKLNVKGMVKNHCLAKSIADASWSMFRSFLTGKAERANRLVVAVNPAYTSMTCSGCGNIARKPLSQRRHDCPQCGLSLDRDTNAAINILSVGQHRVAV